METKERGRFITKIKRIALIIAYIVYVILMLFMMFNIGEYQPMPSTREFQEQEAEDDNEI